MAVEVNVRVVLEVQEILLRDMRRQDDYRIYTRADVNLEALRRRMVRGLSPQITIIEQVAPIWARKAGA